MRSMSTEVSGSRRSVRSREYLGFKKKHFAKQPRKLFVKIRFTMAPGNFVHNLCNFTRKSVMLVSK